MMDEKDDNVEEPKDRTIVELSQPWSGSLFRQVGPEQLFFMGLVCFVHLVLFLIITVMYFGEGRVLLASLCSVVVFFFLLMGTLCFLMLKRPEQLFQILTDFKSHQIDQLLGSCKEFIGAYCDEQDKTFTITDKGPLLGVIQRKGWEFYLQPDNIVLGVFHMFYLSGKHVTRLGIRNVNDQNRQEAIRLHIQIDRHLLSSKLMGHVFGGSNTCRYLEEGGIYNEIKNDDSP